MSTEYEHLRKLKDIALKSGAAIRKKTIDALTPYGEKAIPYIMEIMDGSNDDVKLHGLETVRKIKERAIFLQQ